MQLLAPNSSRRGSKAARGRRAPRNRPAPTRRCAGCGERRPQDEMVRAVLGTDGDVVPDIAGGAFGRGAWVCPTTDCVTRACPRGFARSFKAKVATRADDFVAAAVAAADRRVSGLLASANGAGKVALGADAVCAAIADDRAALVVVARDAAAAAKLSAVTEAIRRGQAVAWGSKQQLGRALGKSEVAVVALLDIGFVRPLQRAVSVFRVPGQKRSDQADECGVRHVDVSTEDR